MNQVLSYLCRMRFCKPVGLTCPECGRHFYIYNDVKKPSNPGKDTEIVAA